MLNTYSLALVILLVQEYPRDHVQRRNWYCLGGKVHLLRGIRRARDERQMQSGTNGKMKFARKTKADRNEVLIKVHLRQQTKLVTTYRIRCVSGGAVQPSAFHKTIP